MITVPCHTPASVQQTLADLATIDTEKLARLIAVLGNSRRIEILCCLAQEEIPVTSLAKRVGLSRSALSQHLALLRLSDLVRRRRNRQMIYYSLDPRSNDVVIHILGQAASIIAG